MTGKELQKLRRQELLQLLLEQSKEVARLQASHSEVDAQTQQITESNVRLGAKLNEKDALSNKLQGRLDSKECLIQQLEGEAEEWRRARKERLKGVGSIAGAALRLNGLLEAAREAAGQYLYNIKLRCQGGGDPRAGGQKK